ncbi:DNA-3-methyladenine glycosylase [Taibaiella soli]|uniref:Putative 3-methyladenine DNA glycosylase n=1 Tax=Taibaiella soli TaxID=1649169 RepID=A0A2W2AFK4_9BACT|nr:DNA-3-methyladenine glycosylase [Taibaiella soli]PZF74275.1 DNA-3-methyladenine glycosylase [Taibaiella soli]
MILKPEFYHRKNVVQIAKDLLGKFLVTNHDGEYTSGMIVETEAYAGAIDKASHAFGNRRTARTEIMYGVGGKAYVYLCYGIHHLFNVVTNEAEIPHAVLIRAVEPVDGIDIMLHRRKKEKLAPALSAGPGALSEALAIYTKDTGLDLSEKSSLLYIEDRGIKIPKSQIVADTRVGVAYAKEDAYLPYRFYIKDNKYVSKGKGLKLPA